jgi:glycosyltransferase involved in cell wall biosynthesis
VPGRLARLRDYVRIRRQAFGWLERHAAEYDLVLIRHGLADPFEWRAVRRVPNWVSVHHTWEPGVGRLTGGVQGRLIAGLERLLGGAILERVRAVVAMTDEIARLEAGRVPGRVLPRLCYPNGIDLASMQPAVDRRDGPSRLLFVSSVFAPWHGLEELGAALRALRAEFVLDIVGQSFPHQERMLRGDARFVFHGTRDAGYIGDLISRSDLGLSSFALERNGTTEACTLKVREYLACGLAVAAGHRDVGLPDGFPYFRRLQPAAVQELLDYAQAMRQVPRQAVREAAAPHIDKAARMRRLAEDLRPLLRTGA